MTDAAVEVFKGTLFVVILASESYVLRSLAFWERKLARPEPNPRPAAATEVESVGGAS